MLKSNKKTLLIVAGEVSGDINAAKLVTQLKAQYPNIEYYAMGGANLPSRSQYFS